MASWSVTWNFSIKHANQNKNWLKWLITLILVICFSQNWRRQWHPTPVLLPGKSHGQRSLVGCSPWGGWESDATGWLNFHFSLSCISGGNGNPLQCSCLENLRDGGAWWAALYGVAQSRTRLKRLSSSSMLLMYFRPSSSYSLDENKVNSLFYTLVILLLNPLIFSLWNKDVKEALVKLEA